MHTTSHTPEEAAYRQRLVASIEEQISLSPRVRAAFLAVSRLRCVPRYYTQQGNQLKWQEQEASVEQVYTDRALVTCIDGRGMPLVLCQCSFDKRPLLMKPLQDRISLLEIAYQFKIDRALVPAPNRRLWQRCWKLLRLHQGNMFWKLALALGTMPH